jgi:hypothetical protein
MLERAEPADLAAPTTGARGPAAGAPGLTRAVALAFVVVLLAAVLFAWLLSGPVGLLQAESMPYYGSGVAAAVLAGIVTVWFHGRFLATRPLPASPQAGLLMATRLQSLLGLALGVKLAVLVLGVLAVKRTGAKFGDVATFAVTFAGASLVCQLATAGFLVRRRGATDPS